MQNLSKRMKGFEACGFRDSFFETWSSRFCIAMGRSFATDLRQRVINSSLEAAEEARSDHP